MPDFHFNVDVLQLSMLSVSPGIASLGRDPTEMSRNDLTRIYAETAVFGVLGVIASDSWLPLLIPFTYIGFQALWFGATKKRGLASVHNIDENSWVAG